MSVLYPTSVRRRRLPRFQRLNSQAVIGLSILVGCGLLVLYPILFLLAESLNTGDPQTFPPTSLGLDNYLGIGLDFKIILNTVQVAVFATILAIFAGFVLAWILTRTQMPGRVVLERLIELPFYVTPLVGALAWSILAAPKSGLLNQLWQYVGGGGDLLNAYSPVGIAWVMALFEGSVAFVMISATMKSMDPTLEESSRMTGASKFRTMLKITLPLVMPGVLGASIFVFAEMLGSFAAALVLGTPQHYYVITTAIWELTQSYPPDYGRAAALGIALFGVMFGTLTLYRFVVRRGSYATISGKAFRPRANDMGRATWLLLGLVLIYVFVAVVLPMAALVLTSFLRFSTVWISDMEFTLANYRTALGLSAIRDALLNSLWLGFAVSTVGVVVMTVLVWLIYRARTPGAAFIEYTVMFPQAVPRMVFGLALLWAWLNIPVPIYGTLWLLALAYFTVLLPLGVRTLGGVILQIDKSLEECARVCGASWTYQLRTVTIPLLRPGVIAAWLLMFIASVRELGVSIFLMGPNSKVIAPSIVGAWSSSGTELTAAMAVLQTTTVMAALIFLFAIVSRFSGESK